MSALPEVTCKVIFLNILAALHMTRTYLTDLTIEGNRHWSGARKPKKTCDLRDPERSDEVTSSTLRIERVSHACPAEINRKAGSYEVLAQTCGNAPGTGRHHGGDRRLRGCYTVLKHPQSDVTQTDFARRDCYDCHRTDGPAHAYDPLASPAFNYYDDALFGYYAYPWWHCNYWYSDDYGYGGGGFRDSLGFRVPYDDGSRRHLWGRGERVSDTAHASDLRGPVRRRHRSSGGHHEPVRHAADRSGRPNAETGSGASPADTTSGATSGQERRQEEGRQDQCVGARRRKRMRRGLMVLGP